MGDFKNFEKKISPSSPEFTATETESRTNTEQQIMYFYIFGSPALKSKEDRDDFQESETRVAPNDKNKLESSLGKDSLYALLKKTRENKDKELSKNLRQSKKQFIAYASKDSENALQVLKESATTDELEKLREKGVILASDDRESLDAKKLLDFSDTLWLNILQKHNNIFLEKTDEFDKKSEKYKKELRQKIVLFLKNSGIAEIDIDRIESKLKTTKLMAADPIVMSEEGMRGFFLSNGQIACADPSLDESDLKQVLLHELLHASSGVTLMKYTDPVSTWVLRDTDYDYAIDTSRVGLHISPPSDTVRKHRFIWFNEAMTEYLASEISPYYIFTRPYHWEQVLLSQLIKAGGDNLKSEMIAAYFEDFIPENDEHIPSWKKFRTTFNTIFDAKFLVKLDNTVKILGPRATALLVKNDWKKISEAHDPESLRDLANELISTDDEKQEEQNLRLSKAVFGNKKEK